MKVEMQIPKDRSQSILPKLLTWLDECFSYFLFIPQFEEDYPHAPFKSRILAGKHLGSWDSFGPERTHNEIVALVGYDYKNRIESLVSENPEIVHCPEYVFWEAELSVEWHDSFLIFSHPEADELVKEFERFGSPSFRQNPPVEVETLETKESYIEKVKAIQNHIEEGDIYEMNFCQAFSFEHRSWNPIVGFLDLMSVSQMPFSALLKSEGLYLIAASPERFLKKTGSKMIAQPIKGTVRRGTTAVEDEILRTQLLNSEKERAENLMIVDLMRNDLSKVSEVGSVDVEELFGVYPFSRVHQMISTVSSTLKADVGLQEICHATFPMGSMTGAPKIKCMELIEHYENFRRGWFSGTLGVMEPGGDFDFNVIIRSIVFDRVHGKGYFAVGSAITFDADPGYEYEECLPKASAILEVLTRKK